MYVNTIRISNCHARLGTIARWQDLVFCSVSSSSGTKRITLPPGERAKIIINNNVIYIQAKGLPICLGNFSDVVVVSCLEFRHTNTICFVVANYIIHILTVTITYAIYRLFLIDKSQIWSICQAQSYKGSIAMHSCTLIKVSGPTFIQWINRQTVLRMLLVSSQLND